MRIGNAYRVGKELFTVVSPKIIECILRVKNPERKKQLLAYVRIIEKENEKLFDHSPKYYEALDAITKFESELPYWLKQ